MEERKEHYILVPLMLFEQGDFHSCLLPCPTNYVVGPTQVVYSLRFNWVKLKRVLRSPDAPQVACEMQTPNRYTSVPSLEPSLKQTIDQTGFHLISLHSISKFPPVQRNVCRLYVQGTDLFTLLFSPIMCEGSFTF